MFAEFLACFQSLSGSWIVMRPFHELTSENEAICDEFQCPLLDLTKCIRISPVSDVLRPVSIVHSCTTSCKFKDTGGSRTIEREEIDTQDIIFEHDWKNYMYVLNIQNVNASSYFTF